MNYIYKPFGKKTNFIVKQIKNTVILKNTKDNYSLIIRKNGYIPKTSIFFIETLKNFLFKDKKILDIGTGETGIIAFHVLANGASSVIGIDIDKMAIINSKKSIKLNSFNKSSIKFINKDFINYHPKIKFDCIISNPPQMPVKRNASIHDDGGIDGRYFLSAIILYANKHLIKGGCLLFNAFDFLGVNKSYNQSRSLKLILESYGYKIQILGKQKKIIKIGSYSYKNLSWMIKQFPKYNFKKGYYYIYSVLAKKI